MTSDPAKLPRHRSLLAIGVVMLLGLVVAFRQASPVQVRQIWGTVHLCLIAAAMFAMTRRGREWPTERRGWRTFQGSLLLVAGFNFLLAAFPSSGNQVSLLGLLFGFFLLGAGLVAVLALLRFPWIRTGASSSSHLLGGALFGGSIALLLWMYGAWQTSARWTNNEQIILGAICLRLAAAIGTSAYLLLQDPRRFRGPLAWLFASFSILAAFSIPAAKLLSHNNTIGIPPYAVLGLMGSYLLILAARDPRPIEPGSGSLPFRMSILEGLLYLPYLIAAGCLGVAVIRSAQGLLVPMLGFLAVTTLMVWHQFTLLRQVRRSRDVLEQRVEERTQALQEVQAVLLRTERMNSLSLLGAGLAHDLNNSLNAISMNVELARIANAEHRSNETELARIELAYCQSYALSQRMMAFAGKQAEVEEVLDLGLLLKEAEALLRMLLPRPIRLELHLAIGRFPVRGSRGKVQQTLVNLVANARDAIPGTGLVQITLGPTELEDGRQGVFITVTDSGHGMPPEVLARLFQPLFTTKDPGKGTGLGLASVKIVLEQMGGTVAVRSDEDTGTTFSLFLPLAVETEAG
jgi:signal transduction histidine kinase